MRTKPLNAGCCDVHGNISASEHLGFDNGDKHHFCVTCMVTCIASLEAQLAEREKECARIRTVADEVFGPFPVIGTVEALDYIEDGIFKQRQRAESAETALAAAREENERLREKVVQFAGMAGDERDAKVVLADHIAALRSRSDDAGRVERVAREMARGDGHDIEVLTELNREAYLREARSVLAAADERGVREFAEWDERWRNFGESSTETAHRFLASRGTAEAEGKEGGK